MSLIGRLRELSAALGRRRALALGLGALALLAAVSALAALLAWRGLLAELRFVPLLLWLAAIAGLVFVVRRTRRELAGHGSGLLRETAALVEGELSLRRGTFVGLVDMSGGAAAGTSGELLNGAERRLAARLPDGEPAVLAPRRSADLGRLVRRRAALAGGAVAAAILSFALAGEAAATLASPLRALRAAVRPRVTVSVSKDLVHAGERVDVVVEAEAGATSATLYVRRTGEPWRPLRLALDASGSATHPLEDIRTATWVYAAYEGRSSDTLGVRVLAPLVLGDLSVSARFPNYLRRADEELDPAGGSLSLPMGTVLTVRGAVSVPLVSAALTTATDTVRLEAGAAGFDGSLTVRGSAAWTLTLTDRTGASLPEPAPVLDVRAIPDSAPQVAVPVPGTDTTMPLDLRLALVVDARDDYGLGRAEVVSWRISRLGVVGDTVVDTIPGVSGADRIVQSQLLDLTTRGLLPGDTLRYFVRAFDAAPSAHMGRSREFSLRLRSMAELRDAVRRGTDSLAQDAADLASDQAAVERATQDLAAQRNRAGDRPQRPGEPQRPNSERANESASNQFEQNAEAQRVAEQQQALLQRADSLRAELQRLMEAADQAGLNDPEWREQLHQLEELLRQAMTPELQQQLQQLQRALQNLDPRSVQDALRNMAQRQQELREQLQRSAELFERAAIEGSMQTFAANAEQLRQEQQEWAERAQQRQDSSAAAAEQQQLQQRTDSLRSNVESLEQRLGDRGDSAAQQAMDRTGQQLQNAGQSMQQASQSMRQGQRSQAQQQGQQAAQQLQQAEQQMRDTQQEMSEEWRQEVMRLLEQSTQETVTLANEEQRLSRELRRGEGARDARGRQSAMEQGVNQVVRRLQDAAGRNALVSPRLGAMMSQAREQIAQSRQALEGPSPSSDEAAERAQEAAQLLSAAAVQMLRNANDVGGAQSGSGYAEAMQRMAEMAGQQGQLNDQLGGLLPMLGGQGQEAIMQQLRQLAGRQRSLANQMERLNESGMPGNPQQLADEARQLADRIEQARLDRATLERQQRLFRRMLDAGRSLRDDEQPEDPERKSQTGANAAGHVPSNTARPGTLRYPPPAWADLKQLSPAERAMVLDYFRRLNAPEAGANVRP